MWWKVREEGKDDVAVRRLLKKKNNKWMRNEKDDPAERIRPQGYPEPP